MLYIPPPMKPETPSTFLMSQSMSASNASRLAPFTVIASPESLSSWISCARSARKTSPVPETFISSAPSPVIAFFAIRLRPPEPACSNFTSPW